MNAEHDESPDPAGTVEVIARSTAGKAAAPNSWTTRAAPATKRPHRGSIVAGSVLPSSAISAVPSSCADCARIPSVVPGVTVIRHSRSIAIGRQNPSW